MDELDGELQSLRTRRGEFEYDSPRSNNEPTAAAPWPTHRARGAE
jgi:hypothetical protein